MSNLTYSATSLNDARRIILKDIIKERYAGSNISQYFIDSEIDYIESVMEDVLVMKAYPQQEMTDANSLNEEMKGFEVDIRTVFNRLGYTNIQISTQRKITESLLNELNVRINEGNRKIQEAENKQRMTQATSILYDDFTDYRNQELTQSYDTDRSGAMMPSAYRLEVNKVDDTLRLPCFNRENQIVNFNGTKMVDIEIGKQVGSGLIKHRNPVNGLDKCIDTSMETFWTEEILSDEPFTVNLGHEYYDTRFGATVELIVSFQRMTEINEITLVPYVDFPLEIVSILIYDNDDMETPFELVSPTAIHRNAESKEVISYQFQKVLAKKAVLLLNQQHYVKKDMVVNINDKTLVDSWLYNQAIIPPADDYIFKPVYYDLNIQNPQWSQVQEYLKKRNIEDELESYADYDPANVQIVSKYAYQYGLYNLGIFFNEYAETGVYVTKPLSNQNIQFIEMEAKEEHPRLEHIDTDVTSIEYYVTDKEEPAAADWLPILPKNIKEIKSEYLHVEYDGTRYFAKVRFSIEKLKDVRGNGIKMLGNIDFELIGQNIIFLNYNPSYLYTIDYTPRPKAYSVNFLDRITTRTFDPIANTYIDTVDAKKTTERIGITAATNVVEISRCPFWDRSLVNRMDAKSAADEWNPTFLDSDYVPMEVQLILPTGESIMQKVNNMDTSSTYVTNKTDYHNINHNLFEPFTGYDYQYRIEGDKLKFNTTLPIGTQVIVHYSYVTGPIRMKVIMRRNIKDEVGLTPVLHDYRIMLQALV